MKPIARSAVLEALGVLTLAVVAVFFVATSWRRWPDPLLDFGQELYNAWQLSNGAVLYRDIGCLYGPLSEYFNAAVFRIFGPGLIVLAMANLVIFAGISAALYALIRKGWGPLAAWFSIFIFISIFGFSQFVDEGNYNYAAPYAIETIHGMLICVLLCHTLLRWIDNRNATRTFLCGLLFGATIVLKPEFILAGAVVTVLAGMAYCRKGDVPKGSILTWWAGGAVLPTALFTIYFAQFLPPIRAASATSQAWLSIFNRSFNRSPLAIRVLGLDHPWLNLVNELIATALACAVIAILVAAILLLERKRPKWLRLSVATIVVMIFAGVGIYFVDWREIGRCLFGLTLIYLVVAIARFLHSTAKSPDSVVSITRLLMAGLALALLARMFLNPRIYHYGYYQAAIAAMLVPAVMIGELSEWLGAGRHGRAMAAISTMAIIFPGIASLATRSQNALRLKIVPIADGRDRFYSFPPEMDSIGAALEAVTDVLREKARGETLTVLPEGESINYFARLRNPVPHACFYKGAMETRTETELVSDLQDHPPNFIVIIRRDLIAWGIERYGEKPGSGEEVLRWVDQNYQKIASIGGDPLNYRQRAATILRKYSRLKD